MSRYIVEMHGFQWAVVDTRTGKAQWYYNPWDKAIAELVCIRCNNIAARS